MQETGEPKSTGTRNIYQRMLAISSEASNIPKRGHNSYAHYDYVRAVDVIAEIGKLLVTHGVYLSISELDYKRERYEKPNEKGMSNNSIVRCMARFVNVDCPNDEVAVEYYGVASDSSDKDIYKAKTGALKYLLTQQFLVVTDAVADPEENKPDIPKPDNARPASAPVAAVSTPPQREPGDDMDEPFFGEPEPPAKPKARQCPKCGMDLLVSKAGTRLYCAGFFKKTCNYGEDR
jgi:hypothetical protein